MYSMDNEGKSDITERFYRTLKNKIYKCRIMISVFKNMCIDKLDDIINKYNNTYHNAIKIKPVDVKTNTYIDSSKEINDKDHKFKISDIVRISNIKIFLQKAKLQIVLKRCLWLKKVKNNVPWTYILNGIIRQEIVRTF